MIAGVLQYGDCVDITESDTVPVPAGVIAVYVGQTGSLVVKTKSGNTATFAAVPVGHIIPTGPITHVMAASTAASLVGFLGR